MRVYHRTHHSEAILREGFIDSTGTYMTDEEHTGIFLSDRPLDANEGAKGDVLLCLDIPEDVLVEYEWVQEESFGYREFCVPANVVNAYGPPRVFDEFEDE